MTDTIARDPRAPERIRIAGLDALRGAAVLAVVVYHAWPSLLPAGFLGVSLFFTLSGFLITHLLLDEHRRTGRIDLRAFWTRRLRRLMPAALVVLVAIASAWTIAGWMTQEIAGDIVAALAYVANLRFLATSTAYGADTATSPVLHFWSLAIEEQFYLVFPLVAWATLRARSSVRTFTIVVGLLFAASLGYTVHLAGDTMTIYFSTFTRAAEVLVGAIGALAVFRWPDLAQRAAVPVLAVVGGVGLLVASATTTLHDPLYSHGGLVVSGLASIVVVLGATRWARLPGACRPFLFLGSISYALYVIHWPMLKALGEVGASGPWVTTAGLAASIGLAWLSTSRLEDPVRTRRWRPARVRGLAVAGATTTAVVALVGFNLAPSPVSDLAAAAARVEAATERAANAAPLDRGDARAVGAPDGGTPVGPVSVLVFGDSTAVKLVDAALLVDDPRFVALGGHTKLGCTISRGGERGATIGVDDGPYAPLTDCFWDTHWVETVHYVGGADVALIADGMWDTTQRMIPGVTDGWTTLDDPAFADHLYSEMLGATDALVDAGVGTVVWTTVASNPERDIPIYERRRAVLNDLIARVVDARPDTAALVDLAGYLDDPGRVDPRTDGVHVSVESGVELWESWLIDQILEAAPSGR